jgi:hypothetical protein
LKEHDFHPLAYPSHSADLVFYLFSLPGNLARRRKKTLIVFVIAPTVSTFGVATIGSRVEEGYLASPTAHFLNHHPT